MSTIQHEYEESDDAPSPMHTDPPCKVCGQPKISVLHGVVKPGIPRGTDGSQ